MRLAIEFHETVWTSFEQNMGLHWIDLKLRNISLSYIFLLSKFCAILHNCALSRKIFMMIKNIFRNIVFNITTGFKCKVQGSHKDTEYHLGFIVNPFYTVWRCYLQYASCSMENVFAWKKTYNATRVVHNIQIRYLSIKIASKIQWYYVKQYHYLVFIYLNMIHLQLLCKLDSNI